MIKFFLITQNKYDANTRHTFLVSLGGNPSWVNVANQNDLFSKAQIQLKDIPKEFLIE